MYAYSLISAMFFDQSPIEIVVNLEFESASAAFESIYPMVYAFGRFMHLYARGARMVVYRGNKGYMLAEYSELWPGCDLFG